MKNNLLFLKLWCYYEQLLWFIQSVRILYWESVLSGSTFHKNMYAHICKGLILLILHPYEYILWKLGNLTKVFITLWIIRGIIDFTIIIATGILIAVLIALFWKTKVKNWHLVVGIIFSILLMSLSHFLNEKLKQTKSKGRKLDDCF